MPRLIVTRANGETQLVTNVDSYFVVGGFLYVVVEVVWERYFNGVWRREERHAIAPISALSLVS